MKLKAVVVLGSVREGRQGIKAAKFIVRELEKRNWAVDLVDPLEYNIPLLKKRYSDYEPGKAPENLKKLSQIFKESDAIIVVAGEYNHSIQPALSNTLDHFYDEFDWKPSAIVSYSGGIFGGARMAMQLRSFLSELGMPSIPSMFAIPKIREFDENGFPQEKERYEKKVEKFLEDLEWYTKALKAERDKGTPQ